MKKHKKSCKIFWKVLFVLCVVTLLSLAGSELVASLRFNEVVENYEGKTVAPSVDFIQPWMTSDWSQKDWENHLLTLREAGYDTIIWQFSRYGSSDNTTAYYPTQKLSQVYGGQINADESGMMEKMFCAADEMNFKVFVGLSVDEDWWGFKQYADVEYLTNLAQIDNNMIDELRSLYGAHKSFYGWYWAYETLTNIHGYEVGWANMLNLTIDHLNDVGDARPIIFSPFKHKLLKGSYNDTLKMWTNFFSIVNFREGDIFAPQDSIGKISQSDIEVDAIMEIYDYLRACATAAKTNANVKFWVNCEVFASDSLLKENLHSASMDRIVAQYKVASHFTDTLVTFSFSHYLASDGPNNSLDNKQEFFDSYKQFVNDNK